MPTEQKTIYQKMHAIMSEVGVIEKDKTNSFQKYEYASEFAIKKHLQPLLVKHGVLFNISIVEQSVIEGKDSKGQDKLTTLAKFRYSFTSVDDAQQIEGEFFGQGQDAGDKGLYKAITGAIKYILTSSFLIPTGDDPESDTSPRNAPVRPTPTRQPVQEINYTGQEDDPFEGMETVAKTSIMDMPGVGDWGSAQTITAITVKKGVSKTGKPYELVETEELGKLWNNSNRTMLEGEMYSVIIQGDRITDWQL